MPSLNRQPVCVERDPPQPRTPRSAFTLVEILMVITTIAILMSITIGVVGALIGQARESATATTLSKIQSLMDSRRRAFDRLTQRKGFLTSSPEYRIAVQMSQTASFNMPSTAVKPVAMKLLQMKYFPQSGDDLNGLMTLYTNVISDPAHSPEQQLANMYPKLFTSFVSGPSFVIPSVLPNLTNEEILYNVLTENVLGDSPLGTDSFSTSEVGTEPATTNMQTAGLPRFLDSWQMPIRFYRWPTQLFRSGGTGATITAADQTNAKLAFTGLPVFTGNLATDLARDPDDPLRTCLSITNFETLFHTPATFQMPLIVSAGPDRDFGMGSPGVPFNTTVPTPLAGKLAAITNQDAMIDNIVSASIKAGGK